MKYPDTFSGRHRALYRPVVSESVRNIVPHTGIVVVKREEIPPYPIKAVGSSSENRYGFFVLSKRDRHSERDPVIAAGFVPVKTEALPAVKDLVKVKVLRPVKSIFFGIDCHHALRNFSHHAIVLL